MTITSPCTGICKLDGPTGWCVGCGRTGDEIGAWRGLPDAQRDHVWSLIPDRLGQLGVACRRLDWTTDHIRRFVTQSIEQRHGTWVMGVVGAVAEFVVPPAAKVDVTVQGDDVLAGTRNGAVRMRINEDVRALTFDPPGLKTSPTVVLAVKRERGHLPVASGVTDLGEDAGALIAETDTHLYDLGLGRREARFCVRLRRGVARQALDDAAGMHLPDALSVIGGTLLSESPTRVVQSALGRIEVQGQIPTTATHLLSGPHTHLLPDQLAINRALPVGMDLPRAYLPGAVFYPKS